MLQQLKNDLSKTYPPQIVDALIDAFVEIRENFYLGKHEPAELNGGKFVEACARLLQYQLKQKYTPIGKSIGNLFDELRGFEKSPKTHHNSYRLHIPRILLGIYNIRNRRGVGHLGGDVNPNRADATLIVSSANWIMAELYRLHYAIDLEEAQRVIDELVERKLLLVHDLGDVKRVLHSKLNAKDQTLILLYTAYPESLTEEELIQFIEYSSLSNFRRRILKPLHEKRYLNRDDNGDCIILPPGLSYVEQNYNIWLEQLNQGMVQN